MTWTSRAQPTTLASQKQFNKSRKGHRLKFSSFTHLKPTNRVTQHAQCELSKIHNEHSYIRSRLRFSVHITHKRCTDNASDALIRLPETSVCLIAGSRRLITFQSWWETDYLRLTNGSWLGPWCPDVAEEGQQHDQSELSPFTALRWTPISPPDHGYYT